MIRPALALGLLALPSLGCAPRFDLFASWTIQGRPPEAVCGSMEAPHLRVRAMNREVADGAVAEEVTHLECAAPQPARLTVASFADVWVDLLDGDDVYGTAGPYAVAPALANTTYVGETEELPLRMDLDLERSRLRAHLTVVGESCGDVGATTFTVSVSKNASPLEEAVIVEDEVVACADGDAWFTLAPIEIGMRYDVMARTTLDGIEYATAGPGEGVVAAGALTTVTVDLDAEARP